MALTKLRGQLTWNSHAVCLTHVLHCLLSHLKASFHLFTAQHSKEWKLSTNRHSSWQEPFSSKHVHNVTWWLWNLCHFLCKRKDVKWVEEPQPTGSRSRYEPYWTYQVQDGWLRKLVGGERSRPPFGLHQGEAAIPQSKTADRLNVETKKKPKKREFAHAQQTDAVLTNDWRQWQCNK